MSLIWDNDAAAQATGDDESLGKRTLAFPNPINRLPATRVQSLQRLTAFLPVNPLDGPLVISVVKNGVATGLAVTYAAGETGLKFAAGPPVAIAVGDHISFKWDATGATLGQVFGSCSVDGAVPVHWGNSTLPSGEVGEVAFSSKFPGAAAPIARIPVGRSFELRNFTSRVLTSTAGDVTVLTILKNGVATALTMTYAALETGIKTFDVAGVTVVDGDLISIGYDRSAGGFGGIDYSGAFELRPLG